MAKKEKNFSYEVNDAYDKAMLTLEENVRIDTLESIAYKVVEDGNYTKILTKDELDDKKSELAEISIKLAELEEKKKSLMQQMKLEMEEPTLIKKELLTSIKFKSETRTGSLFYIDEQEEGMMYVFDSNAICVEARPLRQDEKQTRIKILKTGTEDGE
jgi:DNA integrity scanning protein DisA with diadenylate cyclase activity